MEKVGHRIVVGRGEVESLCRLFSRSRVQVWRALTFRDDHAMARRIRKAAIERGGIEVGK